MCQVGRCKTKDTGGNIRDQYETAKDSGEEMKTFKRRRGRRPTHNQKRRQAGIIRGGETSKVSRGFRGGDEAWGTRLKGQERVIVRGNTKKLKYS